VHSTFLVGVRQECEQRVVALAADQYYVLAAVKACTEEGYGASE
jgi:hypothetical protein